MIEVQIMYIEKEDLKRKTLDNKSIQGVKETMIRYELPNSPNWKQQLINELKKILSKYEAIRVISFYR